MYPKQQLTIIINFAEHAPDKKTPDVACMPNSQMYCLPVAQACLNQHWH